MHNEHGTFLRAGTAFVAFQKDRSGMTHPTRMTAAQYRKLDKPKRKKRQHPEAAFQRRVAFYLSFALPADAFWSAVGHGGGGKIRGAQLMLMGVKPGVPDIFILWCGKFVGLELKAAKGNTSPAQDRAASKIEMAGGRYYVCRTIDDVSDALKLCGIPTRVDENIRRFNQTFLGSMADLRRGLGTESPQSRSRRTVTAVSVPSVTLQNQTNPPAQKKRSKR